MKNNIFHWLLTVSVAIPFMIFGLMKVAGAEDMVKNMAYIHYDLSITRAIGIIEITAVIGLFISKFRILSLLFLLVILAGAVGSHIGAGQGLDAIKIPLSIALLVILTLYISIKKNQYLLIG